MNRFTGSAAGLLVLIVSSQASAMGKPAPQPQPQPRPTSTQTPRPTPTPTPTGEVDTEYRKVWDGLSQNGFDIPRKGLTNKYLEFLGTTVEPYGDSTTDSRMNTIAKGPHFVSGTVSTFGGPDDTGVTPTETGAISGERLRAVDPNRFYLAMRFNYGSSVATGKSFWKNARFLLVNPKTGASVVAQAIDWGPNTRTKRVVDISPGALKALGARTDDTIWVSFAEPGTALGPVR